MKQALIVIDVQEDLTNTTHQKKWLPFPVPNSNKLFDTINSWISKFKEEEQDVIYVTQSVPNNFLFRKYPGILLRGTKGIQIDHRINRVSTNLFEKPSSSCFSNKKLKAYIKEKGFTHITLTGIDAAQCVAASAAEGIKLGLVVSIIDDATATTVPKKLPKVKEKLKKMGVQYQ